MDAMPIVFPDKTLRPAWMNLMHILHAIACASRHHQPRQDAVPFVRLLEINPLNNLTSFYDVTNGYTFATSRQQSLPTKDKFVACAFNRRPLQYARL